MSNVLGIAQSGLQVAAVRLAVSANNVANGLTGGFVPSRVAAEERAGGGVSARVAKENNPEFEARIDRNLAALSGTDPIQETVEQILAASSFRTNLAALKTADQTQQSLLDVRA